MMRVRQNQIGWPDNSRRRPAHRARGLALLELLIVIALLLVLTTLFWGYNSKGAGKRMRQSCRQNLQRLHIAMQIYANEFSGAFPVVSTATTSEDVLDLLVPRYTADTSLFICPGSKDDALPSGESIRKHKISYAYYMGRRVSDAVEVLASDEQVDASSKAAGEAIFSTTGKPPGNNHSAGGNFLFSDGHVEFAKAPAPFSLVLTQGIRLLNPKKR